MVQEGVQGQEKMMESMAKNMVGSDTRYSHFSF